MSSGSSGNSTVDDLTNKVLFYGQIVTGLLFVISEVLGMSSCKYNGIVHFVFACCHRKIYVDIDVDQEDVTLPSRPSYQDSFHSCSSV